MQACILSMLTNVLHRVKGPYATDLVTCLRDSLFFRRDSLFVLKNKFEIFEYFTEISKSISHRVLKLENSVFYLN